MTGRRSPIKGFRVVTNKDGKKILEPIPCYGMNTSQKQRARSSKKQKVVRRTTP